MLFWDNGVGRWDGIEEVVAVADTGSFAGAARTLASSTSHISRAVARLESRLDAPIFYRTTRTVHLTDFGRTLVEQFRRIIEDRNEAFGWARSDGEPEGEIKLSCSTTLGERFVVPIVRDFAQRFPRVSIAMDLSNRLVDLVAEGYDLAIRTGHRADSRLGVIKLASRKLVVVASTEYVRTRGHPTEIDDLERFDCLVGSTPLWHFQEGGTERSFAPKGRWHCNNGHAVLDAALAGMGICQLPQFYLHGKGNGKLVELLEAFQAPHEPIWAVFPQRRHLAPKIRHLIAALQNQLANLLADG